MAEEQEDRSQQRGQYRRAIALDYNEHTPGAPAVEAKGEYYGADEIVKVARRYNVPVIENKSLARSLSALPLNQEIPEELYEAVALLLNEVEKVGGEKP